MLKRKKLSREDLEDKKIIRGQWKVIFLLLIILLLTTVLYNSDLLFGNFKNIKVDSDPSLIGPRCENLSFEETAICLNDYVNTIFIYNVTDDSLTLTIQEMIERGGDCKNWNDFYERYMHFYGYKNTQRVTVFVDKEEFIPNYHEFLVASSSSGYCTMDMVNLECYEYVNDEGEVKE